MEINPSAQVSNENSQPPVMSFSARLGNILFEPGKTFTDIGRKPTWLGVYIMMSVFVMGASYTLMSRMDHETMMRKSLEMNPMTRNMPEEQKEKIIQSAPRSNFQKYIGMVFAPVGVLVEFFVIAGVFLLVFILMGSSIPYKKVLSVCYWAMAPPMVVVTILSIIFMFVKDPTTLEMNPAGNVASNLGAIGLVDEKAHSFLASILGSLDVFSLWTIALLSIGFAAVSERKLTTKKAAFAVLALWGVYVLGKAGISMIFS
jgi:hypothetical protein